MIVMRIENRELDKQFNIPELSPVIYWIDRRDYGNANFSLEKVFQSNL